MSDTPGRRPAPTGGAYRRHLVYWRKKLDLAAERFILGGRRAPRSAREQQRLTLALDGDLTARIDRITQGKGVETFVVLLSGLMALLARYAGARTIAVQTPPLEPGEPQPHWPSGIPLIEQIDGADTLKGLIIRLDRTVVEAYSNQTLPLDDLARPDARSPRSNVLISFRPIHRAPPYAHQYDLWLDIARADGGRLLIDAIYDAAVFEAWFIRALLNGYRRALGCYADLSTPVQAIAIIDAAQRHRLLYEFDGAHPGSRGADTLIDRFAAQAAQAPDHVAVVAAGLAISYGELDRRSGALARLIAAEFAVGRSDRVALLLPKSERAIIALLAVLKAGAAYVPIDTSLPPARVAYILRDAGARLLITEVQFIFDLAGYEGPTFAIDVQSYAMGGPGAPAVAPRHPAALAYVIYTSGSTGLPKGVCVEHRAILSYVDWKLRYYRLDGSFVTLQIPALSFDSSISDIFTTLLSGASLALLEDAERSDVGAIRRLIGEYRVGIFVVVPSLYRLLLPQIADAGAGLRVITLAGEQVPAELAEQHAARLPRVRLINEYGPTENAVGATAYDYAAGTGAPATIGRPIANTRLYIVSERLELMPLGAPGEIALGGAGLARGYLNQADLTAERFVPNPFANCRLQIADCRLSDSSICNLQSAICNRLYRTGDLGRRLPDGSVEFLGRKDDQVKIRGRRIELGEIEQALCAHPAVREAAVLVREDATGDMRLVAYVVPAEGRGDREQGIDEGRTTNDERPTVEDRGLKIEDSTVDAPGSLSSILYSLSSELRGFLKDRLPDYMLPAEYVLLDVFPRTTSGKLDRKALPDPGSRRAATDQRYQAPRDALEHKVAAIWEEQLAQRPIGINTSFFDLGGHSLKGVQIALRLHQELNVEVGLWELFAHPTITELCTIIRARKVEQYAPIASAPAQEHYAVSYAQRRLWLLEQMSAGGRAAYHIPEALLLTGALDGDALAHAFQALIQVHESLRTTFALIDGEPRQFIHPTSRFALEQLDLRAEPGQERAVAQAIERALGAPFDLQAGPLLRASLARLADERHLLVLVFHHIICDGWSVVLFIDALFRLYPRAARGEALQAQPPRIQYKDYVAWQARLLDGERGARSRDYWLAKLGGAPALDLPADHPRPPVQTFDGQQVAARLGAPESAAMRKLGQDLGLTMFMALAAVVKIVLYRYTGQSDILIGSPITGRAHLDLEDQIGLYLNTLALRDRVAADEGFAVLSGRVKKTVLEAYEHQLYPFDRLVDELRIERDLSRNPLFDIMLVVDEPGIGAGSAAPGADMAGLAVTPHPADYPISKFDLTLAFDNTGDELGLLVQYNTDLFARERIERLCGHLRELIRAIIRAPNTPIRDLPMLAPAELEQVLVTFNDTAADHPLHETAVRLFEIQAARTPDSVALEAGGVSFTYQELNQQASRVAQALRRRCGVRRGDFVGVYCGRSVNLIAGALGVWKASGAYVPLDPAYPRERVTYILSDSAYRALLVEDAFWDDFGGLPRERIIALPVGPGSPACDPERDLAGDDLCYAIYTSGSTGYPKGVIIEHRALVNLAGWHRASFAAGERSRATLYASVGFDASVWESWPYLLSGACLVAIPDAIRLEPDRLVAFLGEQRITHAFLPTAMCEAVCAIEDGRIAPSLTLLTGGEQLRSASPPGLKLVNNYGPTEAAVVASSLPSVPRDASGAIPIGTPIHNCRIYILDRNLQPAPIGVVGELYISGAGLARGYLGDPWLTAERFVPNPFAEVSGAGYRVSEGSVPNTRYPTPDTRLYKTGDLARYRPDGNLEFLGRIDHQLKIRGFRVEPGEIERTLRQHSSVQAALVVSRVVGGDRQLVVYVVPAEGIGDRGQGTGVRSQESEIRSGLTNEESAPSSFVLRRSLFVSELRGFLAARLPDYMIPSAFVALDALPRTPSGKMDRGALPAPQPLAGGPAGSELRSPVEELLAELWAAVLESEGVGGDDNFFALGGDSLKAMRLISRVRDAFQVEVQFRSLFQAPTVAGMARSIAAERRSPAHRLLPAIRSGPREQPAPLSLAQEHLWRLHELTGGFGFFNISHGFRLAGRLAVDVFERALNEIVRRHEALRTTFVLAGGEPIQVVAELPRPILSVVPLQELSTAAREAAIRVLAHAEARRPFDLAREPLLRIVLLALGEQEHVALLTMHHIVGDGWSLHLLMHELAALYAAYAAGAPSPLPDLPLQYADYARWQRQCLHDGALDEQRDYWLRQLRGATARLDLPGDRPRPAERSLQTATLPLALPGAALEALRRLSRDASCTLFMTLLAAFKALLFGHTGQADLRVGTMLANRGRKEVEELIGLFSNTAILRTDLSGDPSLLELLHRVRRTALDAYAHQDLPFEELVRALEEAGQERASLFQVLFVLQNGPPAPIELPGLAVSDLAEPPGDADAALTTFDLMLFLRAGSDQLEGVISYNPALFEATTIERLLRAYQDVLAAFIRNPWQPLSALPPR